MGVVRDAQPQPPPTDCCTCAQEAAADAAPKKCCGCDQGAGESGAVSAKDALHLHCLSKCEGDKDPAKLGAGGSAGAAAGGIGTAGMMAGGDAASQQEEAAPDNAEEAAELAVSLEEMFDDLTIAGDDEEAEMDPDDDMDL